MEKKAIIYKDKIYRYLLECVKQSDLIIACWGTMAHTWIGKKLLKD